METENFVRDTSTVMALGQIIVRRHELERARVQIYGNEALSRQLIDSYEAARLLAGSVNSLISRDMGRCGSATATREDYERYLAGAIQYERSCFLTDDSYWFLRMLVSPSGREIDPLSLADLATYSLLFGRLSALTDSNNPLGGQKALGDALKIVGTVVMKYNYDTNTVHEFTADYSEVAQMGEDSLPQLFVSFEAYLLLSECESAWEAFVTGTRQGVVIVG